MKKAFYSLAIVLAFALALSLSAKYSLEAAAAHSRASQQALAFIAVKEARLDYSHALSQVLANTAGADGRERAAKTMANLGIMEGLLEAGHARVSFDAWAGVVSDGERRFLANSMLEKRKPAKCSFCFDLRSWQAAGLIFSNASSSSVSRKGGVFSNSSFGAEMGFAGFGCSAYAEGVAGTCWVGEEDAFA